LREIRDILHSGAVPSWLIPREPFVRLDTAVWEDAQNVTVAVNAGSRAFLHRVVDATPRPNGRPWVESVIRRATSRSGTDVWDVFFGRRRIGQAHDIARHLPQHPFTAYAVSAELSITEPFAVTLSIPILPPDEL
jgi:hypothetical protein